MIDHGSKCAGDPCTCGVTQHEPCTATGLCDCASEQDHAARVEARRQKEGDAGTPCTCGAVNNGVTPDAVIGMLDRLGIAYAGWQKRALLNLIAVYNQQHGIQEPPLRQVPYIKVMDSWVAQCPDCTNVHRMADWMIPIGPATHYCTSQWQPVAECPDWCVLAIGHKGPCRPCTCGARKTNEPCVCPSTREDPDADGAPCAHCGKEGDSNERQLAKPGLADIPCTYCGHRTRDHRGPYLICPNPV